MNSHVTSQQWAIGNRIIKRPDTHGDDALLNIILSRWVRTNGHFKMFWSIMCGSACLPISTMFVECLIGNPWRIDLFRGKIKFVCILRHLVQHTRRQGSYGLTTRVLSTIKSLRGPSSQTNIVSFESDPSGDNLISRLIEYQKSLRMQPAALRGRRPSKLAKYRNISRDLVVRHLVKDI